MTDESVTSESNSRDGSAIKAFLLPVALAVIGFLLGQCTEQRKDVVAARNESLENRSKIFLAASADLSTYIVSWERLRITSVAQNSYAERLNVGEDKFDELSQKRGKADSWNREVKRAARELDELKADLKKISERKETALSGRNQAHDKLMADMEQARLFFRSEDVFLKICDYLEFDAAQRIRTLNDLPEMDMWRLMGSRFLVAMKREIKSIEDERAGRLGWLDYPNDHFVRGSESCPMSAAHE